MRINTYGDRTKMERFQWDPHIVTLWIVESVLETQNISGL